MTCNSIFPFDSNGRYWISINFSAAFVYKLGNIFIINLSSSIVVLAGKLLK